MHRCLSRCRGKVSRRAASSPLGNSNPCRPVLTRCSQALYAPAIRRLGSPRALLQGQLQGDTKGLLVCRNGLLLLLQSGHELCELGTCSTSKGSDTLPILPLALCQHTHPANSISAHTTT